MTFRDLKINQTFDFKGPNAALCSFSKRCSKISTRRYQDSDGVVHRIGTINCPVYHVETPAAACPRCAGWTSMGGMSQHADGPRGCHCH